MSNPRVDDGTADPNCSPPPLRGALPPFDIGNSSSTPIKNRTSLQALFSTFTRFRHPTLNVLGREMTRFVTGPMPVDEFLSTFLPTARIPQYRSTTTQFRKGRFNQMLQVRSELDAYTPFVSNVQP